MSNPMKYIKALEAVGFDRNQAETQVQMMLDALENDLATKSDFANLRSDFVVFQERIESAQKQHEQRIESRFDQFEQRIGSQFAQNEQATNSKFARFEQFFEKRLLETEFRLITRLGFLIVSTTSIAVAMLTWLIKL